MSIERLKPSHFFDEDRLAALRNIAPEAFADGKINWATLKDALGGELEEDEADAEHFGLFWPGKREARKMAGKPSAGTLVPAKGEGVDEEKTGNIYIEGENLEVLKLLRKSYAGRVRMIYIDPPYNTGNDFVYDGDFTEPLNDYLKRTGQVDGEGRPLTTNKKANTRRMPSPGVPSASEQFLFQSMLMKITPSSQRSSRARRRRGYIMLSHFE